MENTGQLTYNEALAKFQADFAAANPATDKAVTELAFPDMNAPTFEANGKTFIIAQTLSTERYKMLERFEIQFGFGVTFQAMFDAWVEQYKLLQGDNKRADAAVNAYKVINGMTNIDNAENYAFELCSLFMNYEGEDVRYYTPELARQKQQDWLDGGIDSGFFFQQAALSVTGFIQRYKSAALNISALLSVPESGK